MAVQTLSLSNPVIHLRQDFEYQKQLFDMQSASTRNFLIQQSRTMTNAMRQHATRIRFTLPEKVDSTGTAGVLTLPGKARQQIAGGIFRMGITTNTQTLIAQKLSGLERDPNPAISISASLMRFSLAHTIIHQILPDGNAVNYALDEGDEIPSLPMGALEKSALTATNDSVSQTTMNRMQIQVAFSPAAQRFYLPQWVAFDEQDELLVNTVQEIEVHIAAMQSYLELLKNAVTIAPYMVADETYQRKRFGILGQLVNQARAMGRYQTRQSIATIRSRIHGNTLNRGLHLDLPYFDDQSLVMRSHKMEVVPGGRIQFSEAFIVRAMHLEGSRVARNTNLSHSTRKHLLNQFEILERAFKNQTGK